MNKETKKMNQEWIQKQQDMKKTWSGYYIGGAILAVMILGFLIWTFIK